MNGTAAAEELTWTIDELARRTGVTTRNIRAYQAGGLLPPPERRGRIGVYDDEHRARLEVIRDLRSRGLSLETIGSVLDRAPSASRADLSAFAQAMTASLYLDAERPTVMSAAELAATWGDQVTPEILEQVLRIGLYRRIDDDNFEVLSPTLEQYGRELAAIGIPLAVVIDLSETLFHHTREIARAYIAMLIEHILRPLLAQSGGSPSFAEFDAVVKRLRPLASSSVTMMFPVALQRELDAALATFPITADANGE
jgi:DNA-binding transcriptional MerR regulator